MRFDRPLEQPLDTDYSLVVPSAQLKGGYAVAEVQVFNGKLIYSDLISLSNSKARAVFTNVVKGKTGISGEIIENALLIISGNLGSTLVGTLEEDVAEGSRPSQATQLVELAEGASFFHSPDGEGFVTFEVGSHQETYPIKSKHFKRWLTRRFYQETGKAAGTQALQDALLVLEAKANYDGPECEVYVRIGGDGNTIYIDLGNDKWECVKITKHEFTIISDPPIKFRRAKGMQPLPHPVAGGSIKELFKFINVVDPAARQLVVSWLIQAHMPKGPYPPLALHGGQGSAKSTTAAVLRSLVDPNTAPLRSEPKNEHDLMIAANNGWIVCFDNLSRLLPGLSDSVCRLATGGGFSTRELYSDNDEILFHVTRPVIINGIEEVISRGDLLERTVILTLPRIEKGKRRAEEEFWAEFEAAKPHILGALYEAIVIVLAERHSVVLEEMPRMADFARIGVAAEKAFGFEPGSFILAYGDNKQQSNDLVLESEPVAEVICRFIKEQQEWSGRATELLKELNEIADQKIQNLKSWPRQPQTLSNILRRLAPNLLPAGVTVEFAIVGHKKIRTIFLKYMETPSAPSAGVETAVNEEDEKTRRRTIPSDADDPETLLLEMSPADNHKEIKAQDVENASADDADDPSRGSCIRGWTTCPTCGIGEGFRGTACGECGDEI